ncbi:hypothetical protein SGPA1_12045 [Streptomyces misionensis JCM 4497]
MRVRGPAADPGGGQQARSPDGVPLPRDAGHGAGPAPGQGPRGGGLTHPFSVGRSLAERTSPAH